MKIYRSITLDMTSGEVLDEDAFEHAGPVAECKGGDGGASQARADEQARQDRIRAGTSRIDDIFGQNFTDDFYNQRAQAYTNYANPQLSDQFADAKKQLTYFLDRNNTLDSTIRAQKEAELQKQYDLNRRAIADSALGYENQARTNVEGARADLIRTLSSTADDQAAVNQALTRSQTLTAPDTYQPLSDLFAKFTAGLGQQAGLERASTYSGGAIQPRYNTGLFTPNKNAVKVS